MTRVDLLHRPRSENTISPRPRLVARRCAVGGIQYTGRESRPQGQHVPPMYSYPTPRACENCKTGYASTARSMITCSGLTAMRCPVSVAGGTYCLLLPAPKRGSPRVAPSGGVLGDQADV
jgi:hypothetical protein